LRWAIALAREYYHLLDSQVWGITSDPTFGWLRRKAVTFLYYSEDRTKAINTLWEKANHFNIKAGALKFSEVL
jgi:hypothetical protein